MANGSVSNLTRSGKFEVGKQLLARLVTRKNKGPSEEGVYQGSKPCPRLTP
jgi:hypothetical protein